MRVPSIKQITVPMLQFKDVKLTNKVKTTTRPNIKYWIPRIILAIFNFFFWWRTNKNAADKIAYNGIRTFM